MNSGKFLENLLLGAIIYFIFCLRLDSFWIRPWDEAIYSVNSYEMIKNGNWVVPYYDGHPDLMNSKPPLFEWCQILFIKIFGFNEVAIRLPSVICGISTALFLFTFLKKRFGNIWAWSSFIVLVTSNGFVNYHTARTGDMDAMLTLFSFLNNIFLFRFLIEDDNKNKNIFLYFVFLTLAFLTKSFAAFLFLPAHFILFLVFKKIKSLFFLPSFYTGITVFLISSIGFLFLRDHYQPGYISSVFHNDILKLSEVKDSHDESFDFYFNNFFYQRFSIWIPLFSMGIVVLFLNEQDKKIKIICLSTIVLIFVYLLIISLSSTKLFWYDMPAYPLLAIIAGYACSKLFHLDSFSKMKRVGIIFATFSIPVYYAIKNSHDQSIPNSEKQQERLAQYIYEKEKDNFNFDGWKVINKWQSQQMLFYKYKLSEKNQSLNFTDENNLQEGDKVFLMDEKNKKMIEAKYKYKIIDTFNEVTAYEIIKLKSIDK